MDTKLSLIPFVFGIAFGLCLALLVSYYLCHIDPAIDAGWLRGLWHGSNFVGNFILSFFDGRLLKAPLHSTGYAVFWWMCTVSSVLVWAVMVINWIDTIRNILR
ncbi:MAG: hypothetical protein LBQ73_00930 [Tannerellaceae bacterium]|jgi:hypothetical protein|nr:hypothetical protein [Tannerellaceae bacterium]